MTETITTAPTPTLLGYARVSTSEQDTALQLDALRDAGVSRVWEDQMTGGTLDRPGAPRTPRLRPGG